MYKVLIVDDEKPVRQVIAALGKWERLGIDTLYEAVEGESALGMMREFNPDIVFVDMKMPNMNGVDFLQTAAKEFPGTKFIVVSGYDDFEFTRQAIKAKVLDYLLKPVIESELDEALRKAVDELDGERKGQTESGAAGSVWAVPAFTPKEQKSNLYEIKAYIDQNYRQEIKLSTFSNKYYLGKEYLSKQFKNEFGYGIYEYLLKVRMEKAREMVADPRIRIQAISEHLGYRDNNYFSRAFKLYYGLSPSEYRERALREGSLKNNFR